MIKVKPALYSTIKGVTFGYSGVIEKLVCSEETAGRGGLILQEMLSKKGLGVEADALRASLFAGQKEYDDWCRKNNYSELGTEKIWSEFFLKKICQSRRDRKTVETLSEELSSIYEYYRYKRRPVREIEEILRTLSSAGYVTGLICNTTSRSLIPDRLRRFDMARHFTATVLSVNAGMKKPAPGIFERALKETALRASCCIHVGDSLLEDVSGSKRAGFYRSVFLNTTLSRQEDMNYSGDAGPDYTIESLRELFKILE